MINKLRNIALFCLTLGCSDVDLGQENLGASTASLTAIPGTGFVPMPILVDAEVPVLDPNGNPVVGWDGSTAELLAADAFAQCILTGSVFDVSQGTLSRGLDEFLYALRSRMQQNTCHIDGESLYPRATSGVDPIERWMIGRMTPGCNIDPATGAEAVIPLPQRDVSAYTSFIEDFAGDWISVLDVSIANREIYFRRFGLAVSYSELNLCMAQRMQEQLNSAAVLFASDDEQLELLGYIRERAQLAVLQYSLLGKVLAAPGPWDIPINNPYQLLATFRAWGEAPWTSEELSVLGADFATAVRLDIDATNQFANLLRRQASARPDRANVGSRSRADWDSFTPRVRLLNLLYGGDPLTTSDALAPGRGPGGAALRDLPFVEADMASPELGRLLGLARAANALDFKYTVDAMDPDVASGIDQEATSSRLYTELERDLRQRRCELNNEDPCTSAVDLPQNVDDYLLWTEHRVRLSHARNLVRALSEALGPGATGSIDDPTQATGFGYGGPMFHLVGEHSTLQIDGEPWIHLDPTFDIRALSPQELAIKFDPGRFLPAEIDLAANQFQQGFISNREVLVESTIDLTVGPGGKWEELRALGTVPVLAFAREAILQGRQVTGPPRFFFTGAGDTPAANAVLELIERAIGTSTVAVRPDMQGVDKTGAPCQKLYIEPSPCRILEQKRDGNKLYYNVDYLTTPDDPFTKLATGNYQRDLESAAVEARYASPRGISREDVDALPQTAATTVSYGAGADTRERRRFSVTRQLAPGTPGVPCNEFIEQLPNGNLKFAVTFAEPQFYVEVFSRKNGVQNVAQNIVGSQVANANGTYTYSLVRLASQYATGNLVEARFYSYRAGHGGVFTPGPSSSTWSSFTYGTGSCTPVTDGSATSEASITLLYGEPDELPVYMPLVELPRREYGGHFLGLGSSLNDLARDAWRFHPTNWSAPVLDAFNLPLDWVPPSDASLVGGSSGEESYQYYLRSAKLAAEEATAAVKTSIDTVSAEAVDSTALSNADARAEKIGDIEKRALCGAAESCDLTTQLWMPTLTNECPTLETGGGRDFCEDLTTRLFDIIGPVTLPDIVIQETFRDAPDFSAFAGGELQRILTAQWRAAKALDLAVRNQVDAAVAFGRDIDTSAAALAAADEVKDAKVEAAQTQIDAIGNDAQDLRNQIDELKAQEALLQQQADRQCCTGLNVSTSCVKKKVKQVCSLCAGSELVEVTVCSFCDSDAPPACGLVEALCAGYGFSGEGLSVSGNVGNSGHDLTIHGSKGKSWSDGPLRAAEQQCRDMTAQLGLLRQANVPKIDNLNQDIANLEGATGPTALTTALAEERSAWAEHTAAHALAAGAADKATSQFGSQLSLVQQALGELVASSSELIAAQSRKDLAVARAELDADLAERELEARFGLRRKFQSYDVWRARALLESARRIAIAARRAIEARFVVDLSALDASQVFVEAPSLWADEIYATDLNAPAAVGLSRAPVIEGAVFPNQLLDYVGNLERFVQGYTVAYPTSVASPDTEVFSIPGPDLRIVNDEDIEYVDAASAEWQFSCSRDDASWFGHPGAAEYPLVTTLLTVCDGGPPLRARYSFHLDPWARFRGDSSTPGFNERHNVRWRRLAVNLVGTGIRDCQRATDPVACYSDAFIRYDMKHVGPSWVTNHAQQWRTFSIPTGKIEAAKGLATEEWLDPIANSWNQPIVANVARGELFGRPVDGAYEILLELTPDIRLERIERIQVLTELDYWVRQD